MNYKAIVVCGPTASGKTDLAHELAIQNNGEIVNCDSMQVYKQLPIITASPSIKLQSEISYHLYNFLDISHEYSVAQYIADATKIIREIRSRNKLPVIVGGSGMYVNALIYGMNKIPNILPRIRQNTRELFSTLGNELFFKELCVLDPKSAVKFKESDSQRIIRAYEVISETGRSIVDFQMEENIKPLPEFEFEITLVMPERNVLYANCNKRVHILFEQGAIEEIKTLVESKVFFSSSAKKALGVSQIIDYLHGIISLEKAIEMTQIKTRQYAKRQSTWFKHQLNFIKN